MRACIHYVVNHEQSCKYANEAEDSCLLHEWSSELKSGITPATLNESDFPYAELKCGRLESFRLNQPKKYLYKKAHLFNMLHFADRVVKADEPMVFLEHDVICKIKFRMFDFDEFCFLAFATAIKSHDDLNYHFGKYCLPKSKVGVNEFPIDYPVRYYKETIYKDAIVTPGAAAFAMSPAGAKKILLATQKYGLEQCDMTLNSHNLHMQYLHPSPFVHQKNNLKLSHGW